MNKHGVTMRRIALAGLLTIAVPAGAGELDDFFNDVGAYGNVTGPAAYRGQINNYYTAGSLFMRVPNKNYQLASLQLPSVRAGCGGISLYGGSFSYINKQAFIDMLRNIGQVSMGAGFEMALKSLCPVCSEVLAGLETIQRSINNLNINSCEAAKKVVGATADAIQTARGWVASTFLRESGTAADQAEAEDLTRGDDTATADAVQQALANPATRTKIPTGNLVWRALHYVPIQRGSNNKDDLQRQILMSLTGTVIYQDMGTTNPRPVVKGPTITKLEELIGDPGAPNGPDGATMDVYKCDTLDPDGCLNPQPVKLSTLENDMGVASSESLAKLVERRLFEILNKIQTNTPVNDDDVRFIGVSSLPIYKMLAVGAAIPGAGEEMIVRMRTVLAAEYATAYLVQARKAIRTALDHVRMEGSGLQREEANQFEKQIQETEDRVRNQLAVARRHATQFASVADEILKMEQKLFATMPVQLGQTVAFLGLK